jgi:hypothetical protein
MNWSGFRSAVRSGPMSVIRSRIRSTIRSVIRSRVGSGHRFRIRSGVRSGVRSGSRSGSRSGIKCKIERLRMKTTEENKDVRHSELPCSNFDCPCCSLEDKMQMFRTKEIPDEKPKKGAK